MRIQTGSAVALMAGLYLSFPPALEGSPAGVSATPTRPALEATPSKAFATPTPPAVWQGQGQGQGQGQRQGQGRSNDAARDDRGRASENRGDARAAGQQRASENRGNRDDRGNRQAGEARGNSGARGDARAAEGSDAPGRSGAARARRADRVDPVQLRAHVDRLPASVRRYADSSRRNERVVAMALARASMRGTEPGRFRIDEDGGRIRVRNQRDQVLLEMSEARARELGHWRMRRLGDRQPTGGSPAFCRSGAGHPVWGREWCIEKGFGLGVGENSIWSRASVDDVVFKRRPEAQVLDRGGLIDVLGDIVFGRLAVQSLALGYDEPLAGRWVHSAQEPEAPWLLRVHAGDVAIAEFVDRDRDGEVEVLYVTQPRW